MTSRNTHISLMAYTGVYEETCAVGRRCGLASWRARCGASLLRASPSVSPGGHRAVSLELDTHPAATLCFSGATCSSPHHCAALAPHLKEERRLIPHPPSEHRPTSAHRACVIPREPKHTDGRCPHWL